MTSTLKHKGKHRKSLPALDKAIEESYPVGYEVVDQVHKESRKDLKGQFIYAALLDIDRKQYIATIKLDDTAVDTRGHFKDIKNKRAASVRRATASSCRPTSRPQCYYTTTN